MNNLPNHRGKNPCSNWHRTWAKFSFWSFTQKFDCIYIAEMLFKREPQQVICLEQICLAYWSNYSKVL